MNKNIIQQWEKKKGAMETFFRTNRQEAYDTYAKIVAKICQYILTEGSDVEDEWDVDKMTVVDDGDYQGTQIFLIPKKTYQPSADEYLITHTYYGSCSGCDTLQGIHGYNDELPTEDQVRDYMTLALHLIQKMKYVGEE